MIINESKLNESRIIESVSKNDEKLISQFVSSLPKNETDPEVLMKKYIKPLVSKSDNVESSRIVRGGDQIGFYKIKVVLKNGDKREFMLTDIYSNTHKNGNDPEFFKKSISYLLGGEK